MSTRSKAQVDAGSVLPNRKTCQDIMCLDLDSPCALSSAAHAGAVSVPANWTAKC
jgi:hypothetical protein